MELSNKEKVTAILKSFETHDAKPLQYINPGKYIQHNLNLEDGLAGLKSLLNKIPGTSKLNVIRIFQDGDFVFAHSEFHTFRSRIGFDIFRFEGGLIVEHWDNLQEFQPLNASGHSMIDGETNIKEIENTKANKEIAKNFVTVILIDGHIEEISKYYNGDAYTQHSQLFPDSVSGFVETLVDWKKSGITIKYSTIHKVLGEGNFILVVSEGDFKNVHSGFYDLFRIENGKIVEHWDTVEEIPAKEVRKNSNDKF